MIQFCIFGGHSGELSPDRKIYITICGGCELKRPTLARQVIQARRAGRANGMEAASQRGYLFVTLFGGTGLKAPTLAEEFLDLQDALQSGLITLDDWDWAITQLASYDGTKYATLTLCGGFEAVELPEEDEELDALAVNNYVGRVPEMAAKMLQLGVGQAGSNRSAIVRQAVAAARMAPA